MDLFGTMFRQCGDILAPRGLYAKAAQKDEPHGDPVRGSGGTLLELISVSLFDKF